MKQLNVSEKNIRNVTVGENVVIYDFVNLYGCTINDETKVGTFVEIQEGVEIGKRCKISSHSFICEGVHIGNDVFIGHNVSFVNDLFPRASSENGKPLQKGEWKMVETFIMDKVSIGTGAVILGGITIGENALVGAGSVVTHDVPANSIVAGNPAKILRYIGQEEHNRE